MRSLVLALLAAAPVLAKPEMDRLLADLKTAQGDAQLRAVRALGRSGKPAAAQALLPLFDVRRDGPARSAALAEALGRLRAEQARAPLAEAWAYLEDLRAGGALPPQLLGLRVALVEALGGVGGAEAAAALRAALSDGDPLVVQTAARGLGRLKDRGALPALLALAGRRLGDDVTQAAFEALGAIGDERAAPALEEAAADEASPLRAPAAYGLALLRGRRGVKALEAILADSFTDDKGGLLAAYYLAKLGRASGIEHLVNLLENEGGSLQAWAAEALGKCGHPKAARAVAQATQSENADIRLLVVRGLGRLGGSDAVDALKAARAGDPEARVREAAGQTLAELGEVLE